MTQDKPKKKSTTKKSPQVDRKVMEVIKIMANTPPISNEDIKKQSKKRQK
jgi:hypothetical protein